MINKTKPFWLSLLYKKSGRLSTKVSLRKKNQPQNLLNLLIILR